MRTKEHNLGPKHALERLGFSTISVVRLIQEVREKIESSPTPQKEATKIIHHLTGLDRSYPSVIDCVHITQSVAQSALLQDTAFDPEQAIKHGEDKVKDFRTSPRYQFIYASELKPAEETKEIAGVDVAIKTNGKIKKGGKQVIALQLFKDHVVGEGVDNKTFVAILMKELDMSNAGATTYAYNSKKAYEQETGSKVEMKKSERKARVKHVRPVKTKKSNRGRRKQTQGEQS